MTVFFENIQLLLSYSFIRRALIAGPLTAVCAALLGVSLVTGRRSMMGDGLSHVSFCAAAVALAAGIAPPVLSIPVVVIAALLLSFGGEKREESSVALLSGGALAVGTFVLSVVQGMNMDVSDYMLGSIFTLSAGDTVLCLCCSAVVLCGYLFLHHRILSVSFDESFAAATGVRVKAYNAATAVLTAFTVVVSMKLMGVMLVSALIVFPTLSAVQLCKSYRSTVLFAAISSPICFIAGLCISMATGVPAGAAVVLVQLTLLAVCAGVKKSKVLIKA